ncbi:hypothetical protein BU24DRAFT_472369 [Aaosphaeria arxii CBS 175.79]|uniref:Ferric oxidoreductase domain-containing protein n=1 Tax=Aaosphaeria arxii CBS 175.79 TaxID=1450172 RepID=A0A6A5XBP0_9PLEO|nr:uncharacterized protein BU24DRAFT_472369 [Aaosphaeria arxii CBS 175.79]KAF2010266.1 hypothetical protein BU24DRAFT_472369 [Aaosphaeria arxii CBS 175.79]
MKRAIEVFGATFVLIVFFGATIGLLYAPCYASVCPEEYLPRETKIHLGTFYVSLTVLAFGLSLQSFSKTGAILNIYRTPFRIPLIQKTITIGGFLTSAWILGTTLATTAIWKPAFLNYWGRRTDPLDWTSAKIQLTVTAVTGHYADFLIGMLVIPISRNSLVGRAFGVHQSTLLFAHKIISYLFILAVIAHGTSYALYATSPSTGDERRDEEFATGNPTMTRTASKSRSWWYTTTTYNGAATLTVMIFILATSLPFVRRKHYNLFYYSHLLCGITIIIGSCVHASTDFYLIFPGLFLYVVDLIQRFFSGEAGGLHNKHVAVIENASGDWYRIIVPPFEKVKASSNELILPVETVVPTGYPLKCFYLNFPVISKTQNHAFTAAKSSPLGTGTVFLFQRSRGKAQKRLNDEWTWKLAALVPKPNDRKDVEVRLEGPYLPRDPLFETASHIICIVGGTGFTGAYSLALWWLEMRATVDNSFFTLVWTIRSRESGNIEEWVKLNQVATSIAGLSLVAHISSEAGRLDPGMHIRRSLGLEETFGAGCFIPETGSTAWVYGSGPEGLVQATGKACEEARRDIRKSKAFGSSLVRELRWFVTDEPNSDDSEWPEGDEESYEEDLWGQEDADRLYADEADHNMDT